MNLEQNYDALEPKPLSEARRIGRGDVLHGDGNWYLIIGTDTWINRVRISTGIVEGSPVYARNTDALDRAKANELCGGHLSHFRLVDRSEHVLAVREPGE